MAHKLSLLAGALLAATASCASKTIPIKALDLAFDPAVVQASVGDVLEFHFQPHNHSVVMGDFNSPCMAAKSGGFYSGFFSVASGEASQVFRVTVNDTNPFVFYCSQNVPGHQHCQDGMAGVVNSDNSTLSKYKDAAQKANTTESPAAVFGGTLAANANSSSTTTTASTTATSTSTSTSTSATTTNAAGRVAVGRSGSEAVFAALGGIAFAALMA